MSFHSGATTYLPLTYSSASGPGYALKQSIADAVAGEFDEEAAAKVIDDHVNGARVALFSL